MSKNDDRILELKKQIEIKKKAVSVKKIRFIPETNCVLNMDGITINLNVCSDDALVLLLIRLNSYLMSAVDLGMSDFEISGYSITAWIKDIKSKLEVSSLKKEETDLKKMESKLDTAAKILKKSAAKMYRLYATRHFCFLQTNGAQSPTLQEYRAKNTRCHTF